jgi:hypothetical protein
MTDQASSSDHAISRPAAGRSRRQLLAVGSGALAAALTAEALARPAPATAADGDPIVLGADNIGSITTNITNSSDFAAVLIAQATGHGTGMEGVSPNGVGVLGMSTGADGVRGFTTSGSGVSGFTTSGSTGNAVVGQSDGTGAGVVGESPAGTGVVASGKTALKVTGPAVFSRSGILTIKAGQSSVKKTGIALTPASFVLASIQGNVAGVHVQGVTLVTGSPGSFTIHLNKTVSTSLKVAWFAVN